MWDKFDKNNVFHFQYINKKNAIMRKTMQWDKYFNARDFVFLSYEVLDRVWHTVLFVKKHELFKKYIIN